MVSAGDLSFTGPPHRTLILQAFAQAPSLGWVTTLSQDAWKHESPEKSIRNDQRA